MSEKRPTLHSGSEEEVFGMEKKAPTENKNKKQTDRKQQQTQAEQEQPHQQQQTHNLVRKKSTYSASKDTSDTQQQRQQQPKLDKNPSTSSPRQNIERKRKSTHSTSKDSSDTQQQRQQQQQPQQRQQPKHPKVSSNPNTSSSSHQKPERKSTYSLSSDTEGMAFPGHREKFTALSLRTQQREQRNQEHTAERARLGFFSPLEMSHDGPRGKQLFGRGDSKEAIDLPKSSGEDPGVGKKNLQRFNVEKEEEVRESALKRRKTEEKREPGEEEKGIPRIPSACPHPDLGRPSAPASSGSGRISKRKDSTKSPKLNERPVTLNDKSAPPGGDGTSTSTFDHHGPPPQRQKSPSSSGSSYDFNEYEEPGHIDPNHPNNYNKRGKKSKDRRYSTTGVSERYISQKAVKSLLRKAGIQRADNTTHFDVCEMVDRLVENIVMNMNIIKGDTHKSSSRVVRARDILFVCHEIHGMPNFDE